MSRRYRGGASLGARWAAEAAFNPWIDNPCIRPRAHRRAYCAAAWPHGGEIRHSPRRGASHARGCRRVATRTVGLLGAIFTYAVQHGLRDDNPAHGIRKFAENKRERRLTEAEYGDLGRALRAAEGLSAPLAGYRPRTPRCRAGGDQNRAERGQLSRPVCNLLASLPRLGDGPLVFPVTRGTRLMAGFKGFARRILDLMGETIPSGEVVPLRA